MPRDVTSKDLIEVLEIARLEQINQMRKVQRMKFMTLSWTEFLEALGRMAEMMTLPSDEVCAMVGASNIVDYYIKFEVAPASVQTEIKRAIEKEEQEAKFLAFRTHFSFITRETGICGVSLEQEMGRRRFY